MKILKYTYLPIMIFALLFAETKVEAATTTTVSSSTITGDSDNINVRAYSYNDYIFTEQTETEIGYSYKWDINQSFDIYALTKGYYYSGVISFRAQIATNYTTSRTTPVMITNVTDGIYAFISAQASNWYTIDVVFNNYYAASTWVGLPTVEQSFTFHPVDPASYPQTMNFTTTITNFTASTLHKSETAFPNGLAGLITSSIDNSTALAVIAGYLYDIKEADYTYYTNLVSNISQLIAAQNITNARLQSILNEIDLDFQQVQTILDLFPSYRTQVLQYWQQLLEMNAAQSSAAEELENQYADKDSQSSNLLGDLDSITFPSVNSDDFDIMGNADASSKANLFGLIGLITNNSFVTTVLIIIVTGMIAGYALYGKK